MGIQEEIKQSFRSSHQKAAINIIFTHRWLNEIVRHFLKGEALTPQQYNVLRILRGAAPHPLSTLQIRERMLDKMSDTPRIVDRLVKKKLASKKACANDKRLVDVLISQEGLALLARIDTREKFLDEALSALSPEEAEQLSALLDKARSRESD